MSFTFSEKKNNFNVFFDPLHFEKFSNLPFLSLKVKWVKWPIVRLFVFYPMFYYIS